MIAASEGGGRTLTEISCRSGLPTSTVHRLVTELAAWQVLERDGEGRYWAGRPLHAVDGIGPPPVVNAATAWTAVDVRQRAVPVLEDLFRATGTPVRVGFLDGTSVAFIEKTAGHRPVSWPSTAARLPAHATALGKALLAFSPPRTIDGVLARGLTRYTPSTLTHADRLHRSLRTIRATRIAVSCRELDDTSSAIAAPAFGAGDVVAAIEVRIRDVAEDLPSVRAPLMVAAAWLSRELTLLAIA